MDDPAMGADYLRCEYSRLTEDKLYGERMRSILEDIMEDELRPILSHGSYAKLPVREVPIEQVDSSNEDDPEEESNEPDAIQCARSYEEEEDEYEEECDEPDAIQCERCYEEEEDTGIVADPMEHEQPDEEQDESPDEVASIQYVQPCETELVPYQLGVDYGQTLANRYGAPTADAILGARRLNREVGPGNGWILSFCDWKQQLETMNVLCNIDFFHQTGWRADRILFVQSRTGSKARPLTMRDMKPVRNSPVTGPLYAPHGYGKGVVGKLFGLGGLLDDKEACLNDFADENPEAMLLQAAWYRMPYGDAICQRARLCRTWDDAVAVVRDRVTNHYAIDDHDAEPAEPRRKRRR